MTPIDVDVPEIALLTLKGLIALTVIVGLIDTAYAWIQALYQRKFDASYATAFLVEHTYKVWAPIVFLGILGTGIKGLDVPPINIAYIAAQIGLAAYVVWTVKSMVVNTGNAAAPPEIPNRP